ncbi:hypothetical protein ArsFIN_13310 [Arsenophonus nasoniae]|uniref:Uncharacterized protein n=1 Tax=Arsenophonus nasoniae TaxID=638 RepID=A0A4P7L1U3_9GAMM|nr:hypothetical protein ArsFIN_13310 [Arsenophonus nasoniae]
MQVCQKKAKAISIAVRKSHEVADVATKRDLEDVRKEIDTRFDKLDAKIDSQISLVRKDLQLEMSGIRAEQKLMRWMLGAGILGILSLVVKAFLMPAL